MWITLEDIISGCYVRYVQVDSRRIILYAGMCVSLWVCGYRCYEGFVILCMWIDVWDYFMM